LHPPSGPKHWSAQNEAHPSQVSGGQDTPVTCAPLLHTAVHTTPVPGQPSAPQSQQAIVPPHPSEIVPQSEPPHVVRGVQQLPLLHTWPVSQTFWHAPQLLGSVCRFVHPNMHAVSQVAHVHKAVVVHAWDLTPPSLTQGEPKLEQKLAQSAGDTQVPASAVVSFMHVTTQSTQGHWMVPPQPSAVGPQSESVQSAVVLQIVVVVVLVVVVVVVVVASQTPWSQISSPVHFETQALLMQVRH